MLRRLNYYGLILLTTPCLWLAVVVGLAEMLLEDDGTIAKEIVRPFLWAVRRRR